MKLEAAELLRHLRTGGRWLQLAYPKARWLRDGAMRFSEWGQHTDGSGTPWAEWYDMDKVLALLAPAKLQPILYHEWHDNELYWRDLKLLGI